MTVRQLAAALVVAGIVTLLVVVLVLDRRRRATRDAALAADAVQRGWRYATSSSGRARTQQWTGTGPTGPFTAQAAHYRRRRQSDLHLVRWWNAAADAAPPAGPMILLVEVGDGTLPQLLPGDGVLAGLAQGVARMGLGYAFDQYFRGGLSIEGRNLQQVDPDRALVPGFAVLSDQPLDAARRLTPAFAAAVSRAFPSGPGDGATRGPRLARAWICLCGDRVAVASPRRKAADLGDIVALADAGAALVRAVGVA